MLNSASFRCHRVSGRLFHWFQSTCSVDFDQQRTMTQSLRSKLAVALATALDNELAFTLRSQLQYPRHRRN